VRTAARHLTAILLLAASGCASTIVLDQSWIEVRSKNFSIYTTLAERDARALLEDLELFRATLLVVTKLRATKPRVPNEIYAFQSTNDYAPFRPMRYAAGHFVPTLRSNLMAFATDLGIQGRAVLYHEYTHFLVHNEGPVQYPLWFDEGFAELLGSIDVLGALVRVGIVPPHRLPWLFYPEKVSYERLIRAHTYADFTGRELAMFYTQSWLLVHYLTLGRSGQGDIFSTNLTRYVDRIQQHVDEEQAFREAFGVDVNDLEERLAKYVKEIPSYGLPRRDLLKGLEISVRPVPLDEIGARLGWLAIAERKTSLAERLFERAREANPGNARAVAGIAEVHKVGRDWEEAEADYRRAIELAPDDWQNQLDYAEYFADRAFLEEDGRDEHLAQARERLTRVIAMAPEIPEPHAILGMTYTIGNQPPEPGIAPLERAAELLPSHPDTDFPLAKLHARAGHRKRAIELLRRIVYRPHGEPNSEAVKLLEQLEREAGEAKTSPSPN